MLLAAGSPAAARDRRRLIMVDAVDHMETELETQVRRDHGDDITQDSRKINHRHTATAANAGRHHPTRD